VNQLLCCLAFRPDWADDVVRLAELHKDNFPCAVVGIDVAGGEEWFSKPKPQRPIANISDAPPVVTQDLHTAHANALQRAQKLKLNITIHAGEDTNCSNVEEAILKHGAVRIGHGYRLTEDRDMMRRVIDKGVHFECCPTSSYETGGWNGVAAEEMKWQKHPVNELLQAGASVRFPYF
jgi:adenosine deaminase